MAKIAIGADDAALELKQVLADRLAEQGWEVTDYSVTPDESDTDYPDVAVRVAEAVAAGEYDRAVLCCGTGLGMSTNASRAE